LVLSNVREYSSAKNKANKATLNECSATLSQYFGSMPCRSQREHLSFVRTDELVSGGENQQK
jgi:hypothetical protein